MDSNNPKILAPYSQSVKMVRLRLCHSANQSQTLVARFILMHNRSCDTTHVVTGAVVEFVVGVSTCIY